MVGGNMCLRLQCYLWRQYYPHLSRALCWESVPPPILNLSPTTSSSDTLPPGSPLDRLRGIQRRASGHKSAACRFLHNFRCDRQHASGASAAAAPTGASPSRPAVTRRLRGAPCGTTLALRNDGARSSVRSRDHLMPPPRRRGDLMQPTRRRGDLIPPTRHQGDLARSARPRGRSARPSG